MIPPPVPTKILVGISLNAEESKELLFWAINVLAQPNDTVVALHVLGQYAFFYQYTCFGIWFLCMYVLRFCSRDQQETCGGERQMAIDSQISKESSTGESLCHIDNG